jgi:hypothetical protein
VTEPEEQLREAFESHENLSPDLGAVYAGTQELFRKYRRRRRVALAAGGAALVAGVLAAGANLPASLLPGATISGPGIDANAVPQAVPSVPTSLSPGELGQDLDAYDHAGYGYNDAIRLAAIWHTTVDLGYVKAEAGSLLRAGQTLPISPQPDPVDSTTPDPGATAALAAFAAAGYTYNDAVKLATLWKLADPSDAKILGGQKLEAGQALPFQPR